MTNNIRPCSIKVHSLPLLLGASLSCTLRTLFKSSCILAGPLSLLKSGALSHQTFLFWKSFLSSDLPRQHPQSRPIMLSHISKSACLVAFLILLNLANAQFVTTNGLQFELNGKPYTFAGANSWTSKMFKQRLQNPTHTSYSRCYRSKLHP